jgi:uncharacterized FlaG/YvyC family protein
MGVGSVKGQGLEALMRSAARTLSSRPHPADAGREAVPVARASPEPEAETVKREVKAAPKLEPHRATPRLRIDEASKRIIAQMVDENNSVVKQIPPEELLRIAARFRDLQGILFDKKV